jgi:hypothetical protein
MLTSRSSASPSANSSRPGTPGNPRAPRTLADATFYVIAITGERNSSSSHAWAAKRQAKRVKGPESA